MKPIYTTIRVIDSVATGAEARKHREKRKLSLRHVAGNMGISAAYLCDMERGNRNWTLERLDAFREACK